MSTAVPTARRRTWRAITSAAASAALAVSGAALVLAPAGPAQAQTDCLSVEYESVIWHSGPDHGGWYASLTVRNVCAIPVDGWSLELTLAADHHLTSGWSAGWSQTGDTLTAVPESWNQTLPPGEATVIGFLAHWTGAPQDPLLCTINGQLCTGWQPPSPPPEVTLTSPADGASVASLCPVILMAEAHAASGDIDRVEYYVNGDLVGSADTAPYRVEVTGGHPSVDLMDNLVVARAFDTATPPGSADSTPVTFHLGPVEPTFMVYGCTDWLQLAPGDSATIGFTISCEFPTGTVELTVDGDAAVTVDPTSISAPSGYHEVTVTVDADSGEGEAWVRATADVPGCLRGSTLVTVLPA